MTTTIYAKNSTQSAIQTNGIDSLVMDTTGVVSGVDNGFKPFTATNPSNTLLVTLKPCTTRFRSTTLNDGESVQLSNVSDITLTVPVGATLGSTANVAARYIVLELNNSGTKELAIVNQSGGVDLSESGVINTAAISGASTSATVVYSTTARTGVAYRVLGCIDSTQTVAGTYAAAPTLVQGVGGQALVAMSSFGFGQTWQNVLGSRAFGTTYYNTTGKPISVFVTPIGSGTTLQIFASINGATAILIGVSVNTSGSAVTMGRVEVPVGASYAITQTGGTGSLSYWSELR